MILLLSIAGNNIPAIAQEYAGFIDDAKFASTDSLMNIGGIEYYMLYENYEDVHFLLTSV